MIFVLFAVATIIGYILIGFTVAGLSAKSIAAFSTEKAFKKEDEPYQYSVLKYGRWDDVGTTISTFCSKAEAEVFVKNKNRDKADTWNRYYVSPEYRTVGIDTVNRKAFNKDMNKMRFLWPINLVAMACNYQNKTLGNKYDPKYLQDKLEESERYTKQLEKQLGMEES